MRPSSTVALIVAALFIAAGLRNMRRTRPLDREEPGGLAASVRPELTVA
jgi:hypothetical protein